MVEICHNGLITNFEIRKKFWYWVNAEVNTRKTSYFSSKIGPQGPSGGPFEDFRQNFTNFHFLRFFVVVYSAAVPFHSFLLEGKKLNKHISVSQMTMLYSFYTVYIVANRALQLYNIKNNMIVYVWFQCDGGNIEQRTLYTIKLMREQGPLFLNQNFP